MVYYRKKFIRKIKKGAKKVYLATKNSLGPKGKSAIIYKNDVPLIVDDGAIIARNIQLKDKQENIGATLLKEAALEMEYLVGDATTTTIIIAYQFIRYALNNISFEKLKEVKEDFFHKLKPRVKEVRDIATLKDIFFLSTNDLNLSEIFKKAIEKVGLMGVVEVTEGEVGDSRIELENYYYYEAPLYKNYEYFDEIEIHNPDFIFFKKELEISNTLFLKPTILLVLETDINIEKKDNLFVVKMGNRINENLDFLALIFSSSEKEKVSWEGKVKIDKNGLKIYNINIEKKEKFKSYLERKIINEKSSYNIYRYKKILSTLLYGKAIIKIGGNSEVEINYKKFKAQDGVKAIEAARKDGVVLASFKESLLIFNEYKKINKYEKLFFKAILKPLNILIKNSNAKKNYPYKDKSNLSFDFYNNYLLNKTYYEAVTLVEKSIDISISIAERIKNVTVLVENNTKTTNFNDDFLEI